MVTLLHHVYIFLIFYINIDFTLCVCVHCFFLKKHMRIYYTYNKIVFFEIPMSRHTERLIAGLQLFMENYMKKIYDICTEKFNFWNRSAAYAGALKCIAVFNQTVQRQDLAKVCAAIPEFPEVFMMVYKNYVWQKDGIDTNMFMSPEDVSTHCTFFVNSFLTLVAEKLQQREQAISILELLGEADRKALAEHAVTTALEKTSTHFFRERQRRYVEPESTPGFDSRTNLREKEETGRVAYRGEHETGRAEKSGESETGRSVKPSKGESARVETRGYEAKGSEKRQEPRAITETNRAKARGDAETSRSKGEINRAKALGDAETSRSKNETGRGEARSVRETGRSEARGQKNKKVAVGVVENDTAEMFDGASVGVVGNNTVENNSPVGVVNNNTVENNIVGENIGIESPGLLGDESKRIEDEDILTSNDSISVFGTSKEPTKFELAMQEKARVSESTTGRPAISRELLERLQESLVKGSRKILASDIDDSRTVVTDVYSQV